MNAQVLPSPQPHSGALISAHTRQNIAPDNRAMPGMSKERGAFSARWSSRIHTPSATARTPTGTLMKNTDCQLTCSTRTPPRIGRRGGGADDHAPDADGHVELLGGERGPQQAERGRHQQRAEQALEHTEDDDERDAVGQADGAGRGGEADHADEEGLPVAEAVTELARGDQGDREGEEVRVGDPLDVGERGAQVAGDGRVGDGHDGAVQGHHHDAHGDGEQREPGCPRSPLPGVASDGPPKGRPPAPPCRGWSD